MLYDITLALHLLTAAMTGVVLVAILFALVFSKEEIYRTLALLLGFVAAFEVFSGTVLAVVSPQVSALHLSLHIALYLGVCLFAQWLLFARMKKASIAFPVRTASSPVLASILLFVLAAAFGL